MKRLIYFIMIFLSLVMFDCVQASFLRQSITLHSVSGTFDGTTLSLNDISSLSLPDDLTALYNTDTDQHVTDITYTNITFTPTTADEYGVFFVPIAGFASFTYVEGVFSIENVPFSGTITFIQNEHGFIEFQESVTAFDIESEQWAMGYEDAYFAPGTDSGIQADFGDKVYQAHIDNVFINELTGAGTILLTQHITPRLNGVFIGDDITGATISNITINSTDYTNVDASVLPTAFTMTVDDVTVVGNDVTLDITGQLTFEYYLGGILKFTSTGVDLVGTVTLQIGEDGFLTFGSGSANGFLATGSFAIGNDDEYENTNYQIVLDDLDLSYVNYLIQKNITVNFTSTYYGLSDRISVTSVTISEPAAINDWADAWSLENSTGGAQLAVTGNTNYLLGDGGNLGVSGTAYLQYNAADPLDPFSFTLNELYVDFDVNGTGQVGVVAGQTLTNADRGPATNLNFSLVVQNDADYDGPTSTSVAPSRNVNFVTTAVYDGVQTEITITDFDFSGATSAGWTLSDLQNKVFGSVIIEAPATGQPDNTGFIAVSADVDAAPVSGGSLSNVSVSGNITFSVDDDGVATLTGGSLTATGLGDNEDISITLNAVTEAVDGYIDSSEVEANITAIAANLTATHNGVTSFVEFSLNNVNRVSGLTAGWTIDEISITGEAYLPLSSATDLDVTGSVTLTHDDASYPDTTLTDVALTGTINISVNAVGNITAVNSGSVSATELGVTGDIDITFTFVAVNLLGLTTKIDHSLVRADIDVLFTSVYNGIASVITFDDMTVDEETLTADWTLVSASLTGTSGRLLAPAQEYVDEEYAVAVTGQIVVHHESQGVGVNTTINVSGNVNIELTDDGAVEIIGGTLTGFVDHIDDDVENAGELNIILDIQSAVPAVPTKDYSDLTATMDVHVSVDYNGIVSEVIVQSVEFGDITFVDVLNDESADANEQWEITGNTITGTVYATAPVEGGDDADFTLELVGDITLYNSVDDVDVTIDVSTISIAGTVDDDGVITMPDTTDTLGNLGETQDISIAFSTISVTVDGANPVVNSNIAANITVDADNLTAIHNGVSSFVNFILDDTDQVVLSAQDISEGWQLNDISVSGSGYIMTGSDGTISLSGSASLSFLNTENFLSDVSNFNLTQITDSIADPLKSVFDLQRNKLYVLLAGTTDKLAVVDLVDYSVSLKNDFDSPIDLALDAEHGLLYVLHADEGGYVSILNVQTDEVTTVLDSGQLEDPSMLQLDSANQKLYILDTVIPDIQPVSVIYQYDLNGDILLERFPQAFTVQIQEFIVDERTEHMYILDIGGQSVLFFDGSSIAHNISLGNTVQSLVLDAVHDRLYVRTADLDYNTIITVVSLSDGQDTVFNSSFNIEGDSFENQQMYFDSTTQILYILSRDNRIVLLQAVSDGDGYLQDFDILTHDDFSTPFTFAVHSDTKSIALICSSLNKIYLLDYAQHFDAINLTGSMNVSVDLAGNIESIDSASLSATGVGASQDIDITLSIEPEISFAGVTATDASLVNAQTSVNFTSVYNGISSVITFNAITVNEETLTDGWTLVDTPSLTGISQRLLVPAQGEANASYDVVVSGVIGLHHESQDVGEFSIINVDGTIQIEITDDGAVSIIDGEIVGFVDHIDDDAENAGELNIILTVQAAAAVVPTTDYSDLTATMDVHVSVDYDGIESEVTVTSVDFGDITFVDVANDESEDENTQWTITGNTITGTAYATAPVEGGDDADFTLELVGDITLHNSVDEVDVTIDVGIISIAGTVDDDGVITMPDTTDTLGNLGETQDISIAFSTISTTINDPNPVDNSNIAANITAVAANLTAIHNGVTSFVAFSLNDTDQLSAVTAGWTIDEISITGEAYLPLSSATDLDVTGFVTLTHDDVNDPDTTLTDVALTGTINISIDAVGNITALNSGSVTATGQGLAEDIDITFTFVEVDPLNVTATDASLVQADVSVSFTSVYNGITSVITFDDMTIDEVSLTADWTLVSASLTGTSGRLAAPAQEDADAAYAVAVTGQIVVHHESQGLGVNSSVDVSGDVNIELTNDGAVEIIGGTLTGFVDHIDDDAENAGELNIILTVQAAAAVVPTTDYSDLTATMDVHVSVDYNGIVSEVTVTSVDFGDITFVDVANDESADENTQWTITGNTITGTAYATAPVEGGDDADFTLELVGDITLHNSVDEVYVTIDVGTISIAGTVDDDGVITMPDTTDSLGNLGETQDIFIAFSTISVTVDGANPDTSMTQITGAAATAILNTVYNGIGTFVEITGVTIDNDEVVDGWNIIDVSIAGTDDAYFIVPDVGQNSVGAEINIPIAGTVTLDPTDDNLGASVTEVAVSGSVYVLVNDQGQVQVLNTSLFGANSVGSAQDIDVTITFPETEFTDPDTDLTAIPATGTIQVASVNNGILIAVNGDTIELDDTIGLLGQWDITNLSVTGLNAVDIPDSGYAYVDVNVTGSCTITNTYTNESTFFGPATNSFEAVPLFGTLHFVINSHGDVNFAHGTTNTLVTDAVGDREDIVLTITFNDLEVTESITDIILSNITVDLFSQYTGVQNMISVTNASAVAGQITEYWEIVDLEIYIDKPYAPFVQNITVPAQGEYPIEYDLLVSGAVTLKALNSELDPDELDETLPPIAISGVITVSVDDDGGLTFVDGVVGVVSDDFAHPIAIVLNVTDVDFMYQDIAHLQIDLDVSGRVVSNGNTVRIVILDADATEKQMCVTDEYDACLEETNQDVFVVERITYKNDGSYTVPISHAEGTQTYPISMTVPVQGNIDLYHVPSRTPIHDISFSGDMYLLLHEDGSVELDNEYDEHATYFELDHLGQAQDLYLRMDVTSVDFDAYENLCTQKSFLDTTYASVNNYVYSSSTNNLHTSLLQSALTDIDKIKSIFGYDELVQKCIDDFQTLGEYDENQFTTAQYWIDILENQFDAYDAYIQENDGHHAYDIWKFAEIIEDHDDLQYALLHVPSDYQQVVFDVYNILKKRLYTMMNLHGVNQ